MVGQFADLTVVSGQKMIDLPTVVSGQKVGKLADHLAKIERLLGCIRRFSAPAQFA
jgi:hypothetical protein